MKYKARVFIGLSFIAFSTSASAEIVHEADAGNLVFGGDIELDINSYNTQDGPLFTEGNVDTNDEYNQNGRILVYVGGERNNDDNYVRFLAQPLLQTDGGFGLDDAWLSFGKEDGSRSMEVKVGRYEAFDLFPLGQDVFIEYNGDTSDSLYQDGQGYTYQSLEGRGRSDEAGQVMLSKSSGKVYAEVSTLFGDRTSLFAGDTYHGYSIDDDSKNSFIVRPVLAWTPGPWTLAAGLETNLVDGSVVDENGEDISDRTGYGSRLSYESGDFVFNANLAYLDAHEEENLTVGLNVLWRNFGIGYIHALNDIKDYNPSATNGSIAEGRYDLNTLYTSYRFPDVLDIELFDIYIGAYYSRIDHEKINHLDESDRYGGRLRLAYAF